MHEIEARRTDPPLHMFENRDGLQDYPRANPLRAPRARVIVIHGTHYNLNLREVHDALYGEARWDDVVKFVLAEDALFLSRHPDLPALRTGTWPMMTGGAA